jgi:hypothetical protein
MKLTIIIALAAAAALTVGIMAGEQGDRIALKPPFGQHTDKGKSTGGTPQILWNGGPVLNQKTIPLYVIYYGAGFPGKTQDIVNKFLGGLGGTPQFQVNSTYCPYQTTDCARHSPVSGALSFSESANIFVDPAASQGTSINSGGSRQDSPVRALALDAESSAAAG